MDIPKQQAESESLNVLSLSLDAALTYRIYCSVQTAVKMYRTHIIYFSSNGCQDVWNTFYIFQFKQLSRCIEHI